MLSLSSSTLKTSIVLFSLSSVFKIFNMLFFEIEIFETEESEESDSSIENEEEFGMRSGILKLRDIS